MKTLYAPVLFTFVFIANSMASNVTSKPSSTRPTTTVKFCRDRLGQFTQVLFNFHACSKCLEYLLPDGTGQFRVNSSLGFGPPGIALLQRVSTGQIVLAEPANQTAMGLVCDTLKTSDCEDWKACCQAADDCCHRQQSSSVQQTTGDGGSTSECPMTWDGYSCVDGTPAGHTADIQCPAFIRRFYSDITGKARRQCLANASWYKNDMGLEWTNYNSCHKTKDHQSIWTLKLTFNSVSLGLLIPSIAIFLLFRPLRSQLRIKVHINLFVALALHAAFSLIFEAIVSHDSKADEQSDVFIRKQQIACKILNMATRCMLMSTFFWMFCEGFYLTWLMLQSFRHLSSMLYFYIFGWGIPVLFSVIYTIVRVTTDDDRQCWGTAAGSLEWLIDGPTVASIGVNLVFLLAIMKVMVRQLQSHNEEQSVVRRSLRALLILIPLFGLQQFCIIYRPDSTVPGFNVYEVASAAIINLQGAVVALIFCFFNGEVQGHLKDLYRRLQFKLRGQRHQSRQSFSLASSVQPRPYRPSLASIDTTASVILAPIHLATSSSNSDGGDDGGSSSGGGSWRIRVTRLEETIAERDQESDVNSSMSDSDFTVCPGTQTGNMNSQGLDLRGEPEYRPCVDTSQNQTERSGGVTSERTIVCGPMGVKKKRFPFFSKALGDSSKTDLGNLRREAEITQTGYGPRSTSADTATCNPSVVISQAGGASLEYASPTRAATADGTNKLADVKDDVAVPATKFYLTVYNDDCTSIASGDDGASSKDSLCGEDAETLNLVHGSSGDVHSNVNLCRDENKHVHPRHKVGRNSFHNVTKTVHSSNKRGHRLTSAGDDVQRLCDAGSLQGSDSATSFTNIEIESDGTSMAGTEDSGISCVPVTQDVTSYKKYVGPQSSEGWSFVNAAFVDS